MTKQSSARIWLTISKLFNAMGRQNYVRTIADADRLLENRLFARLFLPAAGKLLPGAENSEICREYLRKISTPEAFHKLMDTFPEPDLAELDACLGRLDSIPQKVRQVLEETKSTIRITGGPRGSLDSAVQVSEFADRVLSEREQTGDSLAEIFKRFSKDYERGPRTLRQKYEIEINRRKSLGIINLSVLPPADTSGKP